MSRCPLGVPTQEDAQSPEGPPGDFHVLPLRAGQREDGAPEPGLLVPVLALGFGSCEPLAPHFTSKDTRREIFIRRTRGGYRTIKKAKARTITNPMAIIPTPVIQDRSAIIGLIPRPGHEPDDAAMQELTEDDGTDVRYELELCSRVEPPCFQQRCDFVL